jgi:hypothetical protein
MILGVSSSKLYLLSPNTSWHMHIQKKDGLLFQQYASYIEHTRFHLQSPSSYDALNSWYLVCLEKVAMQRLLVLAGIWISKLRSGLYLQELH